PGKVYDGQNLSALVTLSGPWICASHPDQGRPKGIRSLPPLAPCAPSSGCSSADQPLPVPGERGRSLCRQAAAETSLAGLGRLGSGERCSTPIKPPTAPPDLRETRERHLC